MTVFSHLSGSLLYSVFLDELGLLLHPEFDSGVVVGGSLVGLGLLFV